MPHDPPYDQAKGNQAPASAPTRFRLLIFTRYPEPGKTKTRLIPAIGPAAAAKLHEAMIRHTLEEARRWALWPGCEVEVRFTGSDSAAMAACFGDQFRYREQGGGTLGQRLARAFADAFDHGLTGAIAIGTDCPAINEPRLHEACDAMQSCDATLGPVDDGGYYLLGLTRPCDAVFENIDWGSEHVLSQTQAALDRAGLTTALLAQEQDVDRPDDLTVWEQAKTRRPRPRVSVVIPALNEAANLPAAIASAQADHIEVIVADGGSTDDTVAIARRCGARVVESPPGRGRQMNRGGKDAWGEVVLLLHADTRLPEGYVEVVESTLAQPGVVAGAFRLGIDAAGWAYRWVEQGANWRTRVRGLPYGDQAIFLKRENFASLGGFIDLPVMEDYVLACALRRRGRIRLTGERVVTSARRWQEHGVWRTTLRHQAIVLGYRLGVSPQRLASWR